LAVIDLSSTGFAAETTGELVLPPGAMLESFELLLGDRVIWSGDAVVVRGQDERIGGRFTSGVLDIEQLRLGATIDERIATLEEQKLELPSEWRAAVSDFRQLLEEAQREVNQPNFAEVEDPLRRSEDESRLFADLRARWAPFFFRAIAELHELSASLDRRAANLGRSYASSALMPLLMPCPFFRRAYEKPLGYAGDYRMMELCFEQTPTGDGLYGRVLQTIVQQSSLGLTVVAREAVMRQAVRSVLSAAGEGPVRILALAAGPAIELRRVLEQTEMLERPVEIFLLDQDPCAHEAAHRSISRILFERHRGMLPVSIQCLHFSVRQLLKPMNAEEQQVREGLKGLDLVYSAGLYDYLPDLVATRLTSFLYSRLRAGGRLLIGNLVETPESTWLLEYVLGWSLLYRTEEVMLRFAQRVSPQPSHCDITYDATRRCIFLDLVQPVVT
jgi:extracellular factor (EF) 3-hydroxypalmitic acid methyl ester biosynthesis protein